MENIKNALEIVGMPVTESRNGSLIGSVHNLVINPTTQCVEAMEIWERLLRRPNLYKQVSISLARNFGSYTVTLHRFDMTSEDSVAQDEATETKRKNLFGNHVFDVNGTLIGTVVDYSFSTENGELFYLYIVLQKTGEYLHLPVSTVENLENDTVVVLGDYMEHSTKIYFMKREEPWFKKAKEFVYN